MSLLHTIVIGFVEGVTEFLPISSTAHILITEKLLHTVSPESFTIGIQFGAIVAAFLLSIRYLGTFRNWLLVAVGAIPTLVLGFVLYPYVSHMHDSLLIISLALVIGGVIMVAFPIQPAVNRDGVNSNLSSISFLHAFMIGLGQVISFIPGVSRSAATIYTARVQGVTINDAVRYSFLLALPVMGAATIYSLYKDYSATGFVGYDWLALIIGGVVAGAVAYFTMRWLLWFIQNYSWRWFGWYRIVIGVLILIFIA